MSVVGVPDKRLGENMCACIIPKPGITLTEDEMLSYFDDAYVTEDGLGMTPAYFMFMEVFPQVNAKVDKKELRKMAIKKFNL